MTKSSVEKTTFVLEDADGNPHTYDVTPHKGGDHMLVVNLVGVVAEPLGRLLSGNLVTLFDLVMEGAKDAADKAKEGATPEQVKAEAAASFLDREHDWKAVLQKLDIDGAQLASDVRRVFLSVDSDQFIRHLFLYASRDGSPLANPANYDRAWQRNWNEWFRAMWKIVEYNRFVPFVSTFLKD